MPRRVRRLSVSNAACGSRRPAAAGRVKGAATPYRSALLCSALLCSALLCSEERGAIPHVRQAPSHGILSRPGGRPSLAIKHNKDNIRMRRPGLRIRGHSALSYPGTPDGPRAVGILGRAAGRDGVGRPRAPHTALPRLPRAYHGGKDLLASKGRRRAPSGAGHLPERRHHVLVAGSRMHVGRRRDKGDES